MPPAFPDAREPDKTAETDAPKAAPPRFAVRKRVREWIQILHRDPSAEERAANERRARLLAEINQAVSDAPDDIPIKDLVARLNRHHED